VLGVNRIPSLWERQTQFISWFRKLGWAHGIKKMSKHLENKNIVIIGGTTGIGLSAAKASKVPKLLQWEEMQAVFQKQKKY
jgi:hypothetical protein